MLNRVRNFGTTSCDLRLERGDARVEFVDREGIEVLPSEVAEQIVLATRQIFVGVHHPRSVDPAGGDVNNAAATPIPKATIRCAYPKR